jgi:DNA-binding CsgD family transcriptional regulator
MPISWRPATWNDIEPGLSIQPKYRGDALVGAEAALEAWKHLTRDRFFNSCVLESSSLPRGHRIVGFGASVLVSAEFADAELANPRPDINSRVMACIHSDQPVLASPREVARANSGDGVNVLVLCGTWRQQILSAPDLQETQTLSVSSFVELHAGYRIQRIFHEPAAEPEKTFVRRSIEFRLVANFTETGRELFLMTRESAQGMPGSVGNALFSIREPALRLRDSDQQLLMAALRGATDQELASGLGFTLSTVKARWRSAIARVEETMPDLVRDAVHREGRGAQKRHRVLAYVRSHPEELRPFDWTTKDLA